MKKLFVLFTVALVSASSFASEEIDADLDLNEEAQAGSFHHPRPLPPIPFPGPISLTCYAQNRRGQLYPAVGYDEILTQAAAVRYCEANSVLRCTSVGCRTNPF